MQTTEEEDSLINWVKTNYKDKDTVNATQGALADYIEKTYGNSSKSLVLACIALRKNPEIPI